MGKKMSNKTSTKRILMTSVLSLILCVAMFIGTTFAWFTDNVTSGKNIIKSGNLDLEMYWTDDLNSDVWHNVEDEGYNTIFSNDNWEPGYTEVKYIKLVNKGNLALNYNVTLSPQGTVGKLADVINVYFVNGVTENIESRADLHNRVAAGLLKDVINGGEVAEGSLLPSDEISPLHDSGSTILAIAMTMLTSAGDEYQNETIGDGFSIKALATQCPYEEDSFGDDYDVAEGIVKVDGSIPTGGISINTTKGVSAYIPEEVVLEEGTKELKLTILPKDESDSNITVINQETLSAFDVHIDGISDDNTVPITINLGPVLPSGLNIGAYTLSHVEDGATNAMTYVDTDDELSEHNQFTYNPATGEVIVSMATFSEVAVVVDQENPWDGARSYLWYNNAGGASANEYIISNANDLAGLGDIVSGIAAGIAQDNFKGKTIKLAANINLKPDSEPDRHNNNNLNFYPIGYAGTIDGSNGSVTNTNSDGETEVITTGAYGGAFCGTFDGTGHSISNLTQNGWSMYSQLYYDDYYNEAMGLFGYVYGGTVKNLTLKNFSMVMEFAPMGCVTAYAGGESTFENIALFDCNPQTYNTGVAGIVGWDNGGKTEETASNYTFRNITVDKSNTITALWGSWDVAAGGIMGQLGQYSHAHFDNCHVSAILDVYNDVCANYQYYWYRYCGMMIGTVRNHKTESGYTVPNLENIEATGCTVTYDDWNDYYYCELVENSQASYTDDHQFSRLSPLGSTGYNRLVEDSDGKLTCYHEINGAEHTHTATDGNGNIIEDKTMVNLPFYQLFTGYGWGIKAVEEFTGITVYKTAADGGMLVAREKFAAQDSIPTVSMGETISIGDLFKATADDIADATVQVAVTALDNSNVTATYKINDSLNWWENTLVFEGTGKVEITIQDYYYCTPTTLEIDVKEPESVDKFKIKFENTDDYLYRVGNQNVVTLGSLFTENEGVDVGNVTATITSLDANTNVAGTFTSNSTWTASTLKFTGTGPVKVTIDDDDYANEISLCLEVVDATNVTEYSGLKNQNSVLLNDITMSSGSSYYLSGATLYGNGFMFDVSDGAYDSSGYLSGNYLVGLNNANLDNVQIKGAVYTSYGATIKDDYNRAVILSTGNNSILNSYISNCASPIRVNGGSVEIVNTTLKGGNFANLDIRNGNVVLDNVTTINQVLGNDRATDGTVVVGLGVVIYYENVLNTTTVEVRNEIIQYNHLSETQANTYITDTMAKQLTSKMFDAEYAVVQYSDGSETWVNTGILSMTSSVGDENISDVGGYVETWPGMTGVTGYLHSKKPDAATIIETVPVYETVGQGAIAPTYAFDFSKKNYVAKTDGSNDYCYEEDGIVYISMDDGDIFDWNTSIFTATKAGQTLDYTVSMNGTDYTGKSIAFNTAGNYKVTYAYIDSSNYRVDASGDIIEYSKSYTKNVSIVVSVIKATTRHAEFAFGSNNQATEKVIVGNNTYISATGVSHDNSAWSYITVSGQKIYYPIVEATIVGKKTAYFNVFKNIITITDYADGGAGTSVTYNSSTATMPSGLTVVKGTYKPFADISSNWSTLNDTTLTYIGASKVFKYAGSSDASATPTTYKDALCFASPEVTNPRDEYITMVQYSYTDATNTTYYYYVGYYMAEKGDGSCVTPDTLITLANGSQIRVDSLTGAEELLVWNMETGAFDSAPIMFVDSESESTYEVIKLYFSDGTEVKVISEHGFWDYDLNKYVYLDRNAAGYIGHTFAKQNGDMLEKATLVDVVLENQVTTAWSPVTAGHLCYFVNGMLSMPGGVGGLFNIFDVDAETMTYDYEAMARDIEVYGLLSYEELSQYADLSREMFDAAGGQYLKVSIGKGNLTMDELVAMIQRYGKYFE